MKEKSPSSDRNKRLLHFAGSFMAVAGTFIGASATSSEVLRVVDGDFCDDSVRTRNMLSEEELKKHRIAFRM